MSSGTPRRLGLVGHARYASFAETLERCLTVARREGLTLYAEEDLREATGADAQPLGTDDLARLDLLVTLGGDGTLLRGARMVAPHGVPVLGINLGRLGFLTAAAPHELDLALRATLAGDAKVDERMGLTARVESEDGAERGAFLALNDAVLHGGGFARIVQLTVYADGEEVGSYSADGIILSTPTGSTAYSLSAGGPIVSPSIECIIATPICPHTLAVRPLVLPAHETVTVEVVSQGEELVLTIDGQEGAALRQGDRLVVYRAPHALRLIRFADQTFFATLRRKLRWGDLEERGAMSRG